MTKPITIAQLTDVHLGPIAGFSPRHWNLKRALGYANWHKNRKRAYQREVLDRIVADLTEQRPDHIAVTGDLANIGLPREHANALAWLESLGSPRDVTVVPGNHDIYCRLRSGACTDRWAPYMASDAQGLTYAGDGGGGAFPFVRLIGRVAMVGVNSSVPTPPLAAWGRVGERQLERLAAILERTKAAQLFRLVLIHHPPLPGQASRMRGLLDADELRAVLVDRGAELVIHGHNHRNMLAWLGGAEAPLAVVGAPSASLGVRYKHEPLARYNLYCIEGEGPWRVEMVGRGLIEPGGPVVEIERRRLDRA